MAYNAQNVKVETSFVLDESGEMVISEDPKDYEFTDSLIAALEEADELERQDEELEAELAAELAELEGGDNDDDDEGSYSII